MLASFVITRLNQERKAAIATVAALLVHTIVEEKQGRTVSELGAQLHDAAPWRSLATWRNYAAAVNNLRKHTATEAHAQGIYADGTKPASCVDPLAGWLSAELEKLGYASDVNDISRFAKGAISGKATAAKDEADKVAVKASADKAEADRLALVAANALSPEAAAAARAAADETEAEAEQKRIADAAAKVAPTGTVVPQANDGPAVPPQAPASKPLQQAIHAHLLTVERNESGLLSIIIGNSLTVDELRLIADTINAQADTREETSILAALVQADKDAAELASLQPSAPRTMADGTIAA